MGYIKKEMTKNNVVKVLKYLGNKNLKIEVTKIAWINDEDCPLDNYIPVSSKVFYLNHNTNLGWFWESYEDGGKKFLEDEVVKFNDFLTNECSDYLIVGFGEIRNDFHVSEVEILVVNKNKARKVKNCGVPFDEEVIELVRGVAKGSNKYDWLSLEDDQIGYAKEIVEKYH